MSGENTQTEAQKTKRMREKEHKRPIGHEIISHASNWLPERKDIMRQK